ncbi:MAG: hypothetical protein ACJ73S_11735 [Mycobacteriales bacterium]
MNGTPPRQRTVDDVAAPYGNYLLPVPSRGTGVCTVCRTAVGEFRTCYQCHEAKRLLGAGRADAVAFVSLAPRGEQLARELFTYKQNTVAEAQRRRMMFGLAAVLWKWLGMHEHCIAALVGSQQFDIVTSVPSTSGRSVHPLREVVSGIVTGTDVRYRDLLTRRRYDVPQHEHCSDLFGADRGARGASVLVIDDTWTAGARAQSASVALKAAGARNVGVAVIGRWLNPGYADNRAWLTQHRKPWTWDACCLESPGD